MYSVGLMSVWDTGPGLQSLYSVAWEAETKGEGRSWRPWSPVQGACAGGQVRLGRAVSALKGGTAGPCVGQGTN